MRYRATKSEAKTEKVGDSNIFPLSFQVVVVPFAFFFFFDTGSRNLINKTVSTCKDNAIIDRNKIHIETTRHDKFEQKDIPKSCISGVS